MKVAIIGGGAGGLASLKVLLETDECKRGLWGPVLFEARDDIGGIWLPDTSDNDPPLTPLYDSLTTNLPHPIMAFDFFPFPPETPLFPRAPTVLQYLKDFAQAFDLMKYIKLSTSVQDARWDAETSKWNLTCSDQAVYTFDRLIIANGHYSTPRWPPLPGLEKWKQLGKVSHSATYRRPVNLGSTIVVAGDGPSARDISAEMVQAATTVIRAIPHATPCQEGSVQIKGGVVGFRGHDIVDFDDGTSVSHVDHAILATGYEISFPFFRPIHPGIPAISPFPPTLANSSYCIFPLARHVFPIQHDYPPTSVAFLGLPLKVVPFPLMLDQAQLAIKLFRDSGSFQLKVELDWLRNRYNNLRGMGYEPEQIAKKWFIAGKEQFDYRDELLRLAGVYPRGAVQDWVRELYPEKERLRKIWVQIESSGEAPTWLKGVGAGGTSEWVAMMRKLLLGNSRGCQ